MLAMGGFWMLVWGSWMVISMVRQVQELRGFTDTVAQPVAPRAVAAAEVESLRGRLREFAVSVQGGRAATLSLSADDLNALLAAEPVLQPMRESAQVEEITPTAIRLRISVAMNGMPLSGERLFLNGQCEVKPVRHPDKGMVLATTSISVPGRELSQGFSEHYRQANHLDTLLMGGIRETVDTTVLGVLKKVTTVRLEEGKVVLDYAPPV
ncbi:MAG: hypothetical protein RLZZ179_2634 [Verrucomicrobiota bacterium]|jgi:hypothetical protein